MSHTEMEADPVEHAESDDAGQIIHDIQPIPSDAAAVPKPKPVTGMNVGKPVEAGVDLAYEVLDYLTDPDNNTSL